MSTAVTPDRAAADRRDGALRRRRLLDATAVSLLLLLGILGFHEAYGTPYYLLTGGVALCVALGASLLGQRWHWGPLRIALLLLIAHLLLGAALVVPGRALAGVLPTPSALLELLRTPVTTWRTMLTIAPPVGTSQNVLGVVWLSTLLLGTVAFSLVLRTRQYLAAWLTALLVSVVAVVFGTLETPFGMLRGLALAAVSLAWLTWRYESGRIETSRSTVIAESASAGSWSNPLLRRRVIGGSLIILLALGGALLARPLLEPSEAEARYALRDQVVPPFDQHRYVSPLSDFRYYTKTQKDQVLFTVDGVEPKELIRLATMDQYDGNAYNVAGGQDEASPSGAFLRMADGVDLAKPSAAARTSTLSVAAYRGPWVPTLGERTNRLTVESGSTELRDSLVLNDATQTAASAEELRGGEQYRLVWEPYRAPTAAERERLRFADVALPANVPLDPKLEELAEQWAGDGPDLQRVQNMVTVLKQNATYSHGIERDEAPSPSGHSAKRLLDMLEETGLDPDDPAATPTGLIGDEEQFAALIAVMLRSLDIPARAVVGFQVPEGASGSVQITGADVTAWVEVAVEDGRWVRFDVTPDDENTPTQPQEEPVEDPQPNVAQPPPPPAEPPTLPPGAISNDRPQENEVPEEARSWAVYLAWAAASPLLLALAVVLTVLTLKALRRRRRHRRPDTAGMLHGGWQEILDRHTDLGGRLDPTATREETARVLQDRYPSAEILPVAQIVDRAVFGPDDLDDPQAQQAWDRAMAARRSMAGPLPWHRRWRAAISWRSLRSGGTQRRQLRRRRRQSARQARRARKDG
ncbi:transglutaminase domain-containing protein [Brachybacterium sp. EF45031]|uniref:transglutaminase-like domain-containing protein n=1 Tax=Brachybacterium sillae TaxID=2810536 RepID=UPI00217EBBFD|nr:transglutaminase-like domain-containing protein [Brachybacterium sillae]MCS6711093.1 transglutaminase domain-containing protein [Brachybacterium sillae]